jgi:Tol biopolymer transport system component
MPLPGTRVGPYEIGSPIGSGGMGEVSSARDCTLNREVAIKFLHPSVASDPGRLARVRRDGAGADASVGASNREVVYLSDSGGHGNLWVIDTNTGATRQITYEQDPGVGLGVPLWSPDGRHIAFYATHAGVGGNWLVNPDGRNPRQLVPSGGWASWSRDGRWLYYNEGIGANGPLKKIRPEGGPTTTVRDDKGNRSAISPDGSTLYFVVERPAVSGGADYEIRVASPETGPSRILAQIRAQRIPLWQLVHPVISPDGKWLALPLTDGFATNIWTLPTAGGRCARSPILVNVLPTSRVGFHGRRTARRSLRRSVKQTPTWYCSVVVRP